MEKNNENEIENISLTAKQIKSKLEDSFAYDHDKYRNIAILFANKKNEVEKLPFSDYKIGISDELDTEELFIENLKEYISNRKLLENRITDNTVFEEEKKAEPKVVEPVKVEEKKTEEVKEEKKENNLNVVEELCEFEDEDSEFEDDDDELILEEEDEDDESEDELILEEFEDDDDEEDGAFAELPYDEKAKKPRNKSTIKIVDVDKIVQKIKDEAREKNKGKAVIGRRQINKMLKPYIIKKNNSSIDDIEGIDDAMTSIDIYLNAVDRIAKVNDKPLYENEGTLELNIKDIIDDLEKK